MIDRGKTIAACDFMFYLFLHSLSTSTKCNLGRSGKMAVVNFLVRIETKCYEKVRGNAVTYPLSPPPRMRRNQALISLFVVMALASFLLPLFVTSSSSFSDARDICLERRKQVGGKYINSADGVLLPSHLWNVALTVASFLCFSVWLFRDPSTYNTHRGMTLDRKLGTFFGVQLVGTILYVAFTLHNCTADQRKNDLLIIFQDVLFFGVLLASTNLLYQRCIIEKAEIMAFEQNMKILNNLKWAFKWEIRILLAVPTGLFLFFIEQYSAASVMLYVSLILGTTTHWLFSYYTTMIFLRPIIQVLQSDQVDDRILGPDAERKLRRAYYETLIGSVLTVGSTTLLYINIVIVLSPFGESMKLNDNVYSSPYVFGINACGMLNCFGMLLACGMIKDASKQFQVFFRTLPQSWELGFTMRNSQGPDDKIEFKKEERSNPVFYENPVNNT